MQECPRCMTQLCFFAYLSSLRQANLFTANQIIPSQQSVMLLSHHWASKYWFSSCLLTCLPLSNLPQFKEKTRAVTASAALNKRLFILTANSEEEKVMKKTHENIFLEICMY